MSANDIVVVAGGGGFIGGHLVRYLQSQGHGKVRAVDLKPLKDWYQVSPAAENLQLDLSRIEDCRKAMAGARSVFNLAADMCGMGFIETH
jgi:nucleoside-diphosphate-sugar epimerase